MSDADATVDTAPKQAAHALPPGPVPVGYSVQAAADAFVPPISVQRLRREIKSGTLTVRRLGPRAIITRADLEKFAAALPQFTRNRRHD